MTLPHSTRRPVSSRFIIFSTIIALLILLGSSCERDTSGKSRNGKPGAAQSKANVKIVPVQQQSQRRMVEAVGSLFAYDEVTVSSEAEGRVEEVMVDVGDRVSKGQAL